MNIDWSKSPEDATHAGNSPYEKGVITWFKGISDPASRNYFMNEGSMNAWAISSENLSAWDLIERQKKQYAWDGVGDPPVGVVCQYSVLNGPWYTCEVGYSFFDGEHRCFVIKCQHIGFEQVCRIEPGSEGSVEFRPFRTAEHVAAEERKKAIEEMVFGVCGCEPDGGNTSAFMVCGFLYDAGYRKQ